MTLQKWMANICLLIILNTSLLADEFCFTIIDLIEVRNFQFQIYLENCGEEEVLGGQWQIPEAGLVSSLGAAELDGINDNGLLTITATLDTSGSFTFLLDLWRSQSSRITLSKTFTYLGNAVAHNSIHKQKFLAPLDDLVNISDIDDADRRDEILYSDALGRHQQTIAVKASLSGQDLVTFSEYDRYHRQSKSYLTYPQLNQDDGSFVGDARTAQLDFYSDPPTESRIPENQAPYSYVKADQSPLNRGIEQGSSGLDWQPDETSFSGHTVKVWHYTNGEEPGAPEIRKWFWSADVPQVDNAQEYYLPGELLVTETADENGHSVFEYVDRDGHSILKRTENNTGPLLTYYVYDDAGNLRYIIPPKAQSFLEDNDGDILETIAETRLITEYRYDRQHRRVEIRIPEMDGAIETVYDRLDRIVLTRDPKLAANQQWVFRKYDIYGRLILSGLYFDEMNRGREDIQEYVTDEVDGDSYQFGECLDEDGEQGYSNTAFPDIDVCQIWSVNYFDSYHFPEALALAYIADEDFEDDRHQPHFQLKGMQTGTKTRILLQNVFEGSHQSYGSGHPPARISEAYYKGDHLTFRTGFHTQPGQTVNIGNNITLPDDALQLWVSSVTYYNRFLKAIQRQSTNHLGGHDIRFTKYDFSGKIDRSMRWHQVGGNVIQVRERFVYDNGGRLSERYHQIDDAPEVLLLQNQYNELGILVERNLHYDEDSEDFLQSVDYNYNERGWLSGINSPSLDDGEGDLFGMALQYQDDRFDLEDVVEDYQHAYNGNISAAVWKVDANADGGSNDTRHGYHFSHTSLNQLESADYYAGNNWQSGENRYTVTDINYDLNGNITGLRRFGNDDDHTIEIDDLTYFYKKGNRLHGVDDLALQGDGNRHYDFEDNGSVYTTSTPEYLFDANGNLTHDSNKGVQITYNELNLPILADFGNGRTIEWLYSADGQRLGKQVFFPDAPAETRDYVDGFEYANYSLDVINTSEGQILVDNDDFQYQYHLKDHLGNVRVLFAADNGQANVLQANHYYPFGMQMAGIGSNAGTENQYLYNGKAYSDEHDLHWYNYGARYYDPQLGRWMVVDPADQYYSPYTYVDNNPVRRVDPDGQYGEEAILWSIAIAEPTPIGEVIAGVYTLVKWSAIAATTWYASTKVADDIANMDKTIPRAVPLPLDKTTDEPIERTTPAQTATIYAWEVPGQGLPHFSIVINDLHTHQVTDAYDQSTTMFHFEKGNKNLITSITLPIANAPAANNYQRSQIFADRGKYHKIYNNCLTTCVDVLNAGGLDIGTKEVRRMLRKSLKK